MAGSKARQGLGGRLVGGLLMAFIPAVFGLVRLLGPDWSAALGGWVARGIGPLLPAHRTALANLRLKSGRQRRKISLQTTHLYRSCKSFINVFLITSKENILAYRGISYVRFLRHIGNA